MKLETNLQPRALAKLGILIRDGEILLHRNMWATPDAFLKAVAPYREDLVVGVECMFTWYWLADLCDTPST